MWIKWSALVLNLLWKNEICPFLSFRETPLIFWKLGNFTHGLNVTLWSLICYQRITFVVLFVLETRKVSINTPNFLKIWLFNTCVSCSDCVVILLWKKWNLSFWVKQESHRWNKGLFLGLREFLLFGGH